MEPAGCSHFSISLTQRACNRHGQIGVTKKQRCCYYGDFPHQDVQDGMRQLLPTRYITQPSHSQVELPYPQSYSISGYSVYNALLSLTSPAILLENINEIFFSMNLIFSTIQPMQHTQFNTACKSLTLSIMISHLQRTE